MAQAPDFDGQMLLLATQISHESDMKGLLLAVLETLLEALKSRDSTDIIGEAITLTRCIIRLITKLLAEPVANTCASTFVIGCRLMIYCISRVSLTNVLIKHFTNGTYLSVQV